MRRYEIMVIFSGKTNEARLKELTTTFEKKITDNDGNIVKKEELGLKSFAYEIKKEDKGFYNVYYAETNSENIEEINRYYRITSDILRIMVIKHEDKWPYEMNLEVKNKLPIKHTRKNYKRKFDNRENTKVDHSKEGDSKNEAPKAVAQKENNSGK